MAKACADYGTYLELNAKKVHLKDEELSMKEIFEAELDYVGYVSYTDNTFNEKVCVVTNIEENQIDLSPTKTPKPTSTPTPTKEPQQFEWNIQIIGVIIVVLFVIVGFGFILLYNINKKKNKTTRSTEKEQGGK